MCICSVISPRLAPLLVEWLLHRRRSPPTGTSEVGSNSITLKGAIQFFNLFAVFPPRLTDANHFDVFILFLMITGLHSPMKSVGSDGNRIMRSNGAGEIISTKRFKNSRCFYRKNGSRVGHPPVGMARARVRVSPVCYLVPSVDLRSEPVVCSTRIRRRSKRTRALF